MLHPFDIPDNVAVTLQEFRERSADPLNRSQHVLAFCAFTREQVHDVSVRCLAELDRQERPYNVVDCARKSDLQMLTEVAGAEAGRYRTVYDAAVAAGERLASRSETLVLLNPSAKKRGHRAAHLIYDLMKDAYEGHRPVSRHHESRPAGSDIVLVDLTSFVEASWDKLGFYFVCELYERPRPLPRALFRPN